MTSFDHAPTVVRVTIRVETVHGLTEHHVEVDDPADTAMALARAYSAAHAALREPVDDGDDVAWVPVPQPVREPVTANGRAT